MRPGPRITATTLREAEKLAGLRFTSGERTLALAGLETQLDRARRLDDLAMPNDAAPASTFDPRLPNSSYAPGDGSTHFTQPRESAGPADDAEIAHAPLPLLGYWLRTGVLTSAHLTEIYLDRIRRVGPRLECIVTITESLARAQSARADAELRVGHDRGPLHGIPWGAKDLLDTAGIPTSWGAAPYRDRVPTMDAAVVRRLEAAGAVLIAKTSLGELAFGDVWFGGRTRNPWNLEEGAGGSSAGSASAVAAGLMGFSIGSETLNSIVAPCMRCGTSGLRPTFGRVARTGSMALAWSMDKLGPICRTVEDTAMVLAAINGADPGDPDSLDMPFTFGAARDVEGLTLGYDPAWFEEAPACHLDRAVLDVARVAGIRLVEIALPDLPYDAMWTILAVESASALDELTRSGRDAELVRQDKDAWPSMLRRARFVPAVDYLRAQRLRRRVMGEVDSIFRGVNALIGPSFAGRVQLITSMTGHPALTLRTGFVETPRRTALNVMGTVAKPDSPHAPAHRVPHGITLWGRLYDEGTLCAIGIAIERALDVWRTRPPETASE